MQHYKSKSSTLAKKMEPIWEEKFPLDCSFVQEYFFIELSLSTPEPSKPNILTSNLLEEAMKRSYRKVPM